MGAGVDVSVEVGSGVIVSEGRGEMDVSAATRLVDVSTGCGEGEAGACPVAVLRPQASIVSVRRMGRKNFLRFIF